MSTRRIISRAAITALLFQAMTTAVYATPLTEQIIAQFAQTWMPVTERLVAIDAEFDPQNPAGLNAQLQQMAHDDGPDSARDKAVQADGYPDFESWAATAIQIMTAAQWAKDPIDAQDVETAIGVINSNENQNANDKALLIEDVKSAYEIALRQKPDQSDIDMAKRLLPLLEPIISPKL